MGARFKDWKYQDRLSSRRPARISGAMRAVFRPNIARRLHHSHHGRGVRGQLVAPHWNGTARFSAIKIAPTSRPLAFSVPQRRPKLQASVPSVPGRQAHGTNSKSRLLARTRSRSRRVALPPSSCSTWHWARRVSGALKPTSRTSGRLWCRRIVSPSITVTSLG